MRRMSKRLWMGLLALVVAAGVTTSANALSTVNLVPGPDPLVTGGSPDDPLLAGFKSWDLEVTVPVGLDWTNSQIQFTLTAGTFYDLTLMPDADIPQNTAFWGFPGFRYIGHDSMYMAPPTPPGVGINGALVAIPGIAGRHPADGVGAPINLPTYKSAAWFDTNNTGAGTFVIARFTISIGAVGTLVVDTIDNNIANDGGNFGQVINFGAAPPIPVPAAAWMGLAGLGLIPVLRRRLVR